MADLNNYSPTPTKSDVQYSEKHIIDALYKLLGSGGGGGGGAVTIADGADVAEGNTSDSPWSLAGNATVIALLKKIALEGSAIQTNTDSITKQNNSKIIPPLNVNAVLNESLTIDMEDYDYAVIQLVGGSGWVIQHENSNDGVTYSNVENIRLMSDARTLTVPSTGTIALPAMYVLNSAPRYLRLRRSSVGTGVVTAHITLRKNVDMSGMGKVMVAFPSPPTVNATLPNTTAIVPVPSATATNLTTHFTLVSTASTNATSVATGQKGLVFIQLSNNSASPRYLKLFKKASTPIIGTDSPAMNIMIPPNGSISIEYPLQHAWGAGIALAITGGAPLLDATAIGANEVLVNIGYV